MELLQRDFILLGLGSAEDPISDLGMIERSRVKVQCRVKGDHCEVLLLPGKLEADVRSDPHQKYF